MCIYVCIYTYTHTQSLMYILENKPQQMGPFKQEMYGYEYAKGGPELNFGVGTRGPNCSAKGNL